MDKRQCDKLIANFSNELEIKKHDSTLKNYFFVGTYGRSRGLKIKIKRKIDEGENVLERNPNKETLEEVGSRKEWK